MIKRRGIKAHLLKGGVTKKIVTVFTKQAYHPSKNMNSTYRPKGSKIMWQNEFKLIELKQIERNIS